MITNYTEQHGWLVTTGSDKPILSVFTGPTILEQKWLREIHKIGDHNISAALSDDSEANVSMEFSHAALIFKAPLSTHSPEGGSFETTVVGFFLFESELIVIMREAIDILGKLPQRQQMTPASIMLHAISRIIFEFSVGLKNISRAYDNIEEKANISMDNKDLIDLFTIEKELIYFLSGMNSNAYVFEKLSRFMERLNCDEDDLTELQSVESEARRLCKQAEMYSNITATLSSARVSIVSNNLTALMKNLNILTIGIMVPTFVVSAFSMNVEIPLQHSRYAFVLVMIFATLSVALFFFYWKFSTVRIRK
jgi:magnesium transporter